MLCSKLSLLTIMQIWMMICVHDDQRRSPIETTFVAQCVRIFQLKISKTKKNPIYKKKIKDNEVVVVVVFDENEISIIGFT